MQVWVNQKTNLLYACCYLHQRGYVFTRVCLCVCLIIFLLSELLKTTDKIFVKFYGMVGHNPGSNQFDFGGNQDLDPDPGVFWRNFTIALLATVKAHRGVGSSPKKRRLADLNWNKLKAALSEVCALRVLHLF